MNKKQKAVVWIALFLFVNTLFNAPWTMKYMQVQTVLSTQPIWNPPNVSPQLQTGALVTEWMALAILTGTLVFLLKGTREKH